MFGRILLFHYILNADSGTWVLYKGRSRRDEVQPAPEVRRKNPPPRFASALKTPEAAHDSSEEGEQEAPSDDGGDEEEEERERVYQVSGGNNAYKSAPMPQSVEPCWK